MTAKLVAVVVLLFAAQAAYSGPLDLGAVLNAILGPVLTTLGGITTSLTNTAGGALGGVINIGGGATINLNVVTPSVQGIVDAVKALATSGQLTGTALNDVTGILQQINTVLAIASSGPLDANSIIALANNLKGLLSQLTVKLATNGISSIAINNNIATIINALNQATKTANGVLGGLVDTVLNALNGALQTVGGLLNNLLGQVNATTSSLKGIAADTLNNIQNILDQVQNLATNGTLSGTVLDNVNKIVGQIQTALQNALTGLAAGQTLDQVFATLTPTLNNLLSQLKVLLNGSGGGALDASLANALSSLTNIINALSSSTATG